MTTQSIAQSHPAREDMALINRYTRREFTPEEVYAFSVILCDNEIDRDMERFTPAALSTLAGLYVGKTGIFDHQPSGKNQAARVYAAEVLAEPDRVTSDGEKYCCLKARAYMVRSDENAALIREIEGGIKKEVSVGCAVGRVSCSVCGGSAQECGHEKGKRYGGKLCHYRLDDPTDAYEWSFVAVPAQRGAGVIKQFHPTADGVLKALEALTEGTLTEENPESGFLETGNPEEIVPPAGILKKSGAAGLQLTPEEAAVLTRRFRALEREAALGRSYRDELAGEVRRLAFLAGEELPPEILDSVVKKMNVGELKGFQRAYEARLERPLAPQLAPGRSPGENREFQM